MIKAMIKRNLKQKAVWWQTTGRNRYNETTFADPVEINCRWEQKEQLMKDAEGNEIVSKAQVFHDKSVSYRDRLYFGTLGDLDSSDEENPLQANDVYEVKNTEKFAQIGSNKNYLKTAYLG